MSSKKKKKVAPAAPPPNLAEKTFAPRRWIWFIAAVVILTVSVVWYLHHKRTLPDSSSIVAAESPETVLDSLSKSNFKNSEKQVAEKLRSLIQDVQSNPSSAHAWGKLAMNLDVHDLRKEALICYRKAAVLNPSDVRWPYYEAVILYERGSTEEALKYFEQAINLNPNYLAARVRYGQALFDSGRIEQSAREFLKATQIDPASSHGYLGLARISLNQGQLKDCGSLLQKAIQVNSRHGEAYGLMSEVYRRLNQPQKARAQLLIAQQLPKKTPIPDELMSDLIAEGVSSYWYDERGRDALERADYSTAESQLKMAAQLSSAPAHYDTLGAVYLYERKFAEAVAAHRKALDLNPKSTTAWNNLAAALYETGKKEEAFDAISRAIQLDPKFSYSYLHLARLKQRSGDPAGAVQAYRSGLQQLPQNSEMALQLAWLLATSSDASLRNGQEAVRLAERAASQGVNADSLDVLAAAYAEAGQFDRAVQVEEKALAMAQANNRKPLAERIQSHLKLFRAKRPYHE